MGSTKRIIFNTGAQYIKAIITTCIALYSTRIILDTLCENDYGIYIVIAGVVALLGFVTNALVNTTQRYMSFYKTSQTTEYLRKLFSNSLFIHFIIGIIIVIVLLALKGLLFQSVLTIDPLRIAVAEQMYIITSFMLLATILTSPFKALLIAHENIFFIVVVEIIDSVVKLFLAVILAYVPFDKLLTYQWMIAAIVLLNLLVFSLYASLKYPECTILIRRKDIEMSHIKMMIGYAGWTTYGMGCVAARAQGTSLVLNHFLGTVVNAAYGIAFQIHSAISFIVVSILNAMNPQLVQAEGEGNRDSMFRMAEMQSKFSTAILAIVIVPLIAEMPIILDVWLKDVPDNTTMFCRFVLLAFLCDQITIGLTSANQAIGKIKVFTLVTYTPKLLYLIIVWVLLQNHCSVHIIMELWVAIELLVAIIRIPYMHYSAGLDGIHYVKSVILPVLCQIVLMSAACWCCIEYLCIPFRFVLTSLCAISIGAFVGWFFVLDKQERSFICDCIRHLHGNEAQGY